MQTIKNRLGYPTPNPGQRIIWDYGLKFKNM